MARYAHTVTTENQPITDSYPAHAQSDRELLEAIYARLAVLEGEMNRLLSAWTAGGLRGLRRAASNGRD